MASKNKTGIIKDNKKSFANMFQVFLLRPPIVKMGSLTLTFKKFNQDGVVISPVELGRIVHRILSNHLIGSSRENSKLIVPIAETISSKTFKAISDNLLDEIKREYRVYKVKIFLKSMHNRWPLFDMLPQRDNESYPYKIAFSCQNALWNATNQWQQIFDLEVTELNHARLSVRINIPPELSIKQQKELHKIFQRLNHQRTPGSSLTSRVTTTRKNLSKRLGGEARHEHDIPHGDVETKEEAAITWSEQLQYPAQENHPLVYPIETHSGVNHYVVNNVVNRDDFRTEKDWNRFNSIMRHARLVTAKRAQGVKLVAETERDARGNRIECDIKIKFGKSSCRVFGRRYAGADGQPPLYEITHVSYKHN